MYMAARIHEKIYIKKQNSLSLSPAADELFDDEVERRKQFLAGQEFSRRRRVMQAYL